MTSLVSNGKHKRKHAAEEKLPQPRKPEIPDVVGLEMHSEDDEDGEGESDDGEADEFPELDVRSDTSEEYQSEDEEDEGEDDGEEDDEDEESDRDLHIFPKAKTITSDITGQPKKVYPEIEPDYDSDSSTEDVSVKLFVQ